MSEIVTADTFLNGRVAISQPAAGYRAAIDPVLLAAACPAGTHDHVLDAGCGVATAALCLMARMGCSATGIELQPDLAGLASLNAERNAPNGGLDIVTGSILMPPSHVKQAQFEHVLCNPPYLPENYGSGEVNDADYEGEAKLADWVEFCSRRVRDGGSVTFIHRADRLDELLALMTAKLGAIAVFPLWPNAATRARRVIVGGIKGRRTPMRLLPGLALHEADGTYTDQANAILRDGQPIRLWDI